jgi:hypothetical protein
MVSASGLARDVDLDQGHDLSDEPLPYGAFASRSQARRARTPFSLTPAIGTRPAIGRALHAQRVHITRSLLPPRMVDTGDTVVGRTTRAFAFAGIERPERFFST